MGETIPETGIIKNSKTGWLKYSVILSCVVYIVILYAERLAAVIIGFTSAEPFYTGSNAAQWYAHIITIVALVSSLIAAFTINRTAFIYLFTRRCADYDLIDFRMLSVNAGLILLGGMAHTTFTLLGVQFVSYACLLISLMLRMIDGGYMNRPDVTRGRLIISYLYLACFSMAIPVVYGTVGAIRYAYLILEVITSILLVIVFTALMSVYYRSGGLLNFGIPVILYTTAADLALIILRAPETLNVFVAVFLGLTVLFWLIGRIKYGNRVTLYFTGKYKRKRYFEGWYVKLTGADKKTIALIISYHADRQGTEYAMLQVAGKNGFCEKIAASDFSADEDHFNVKLGKSVVNCRGLDIDFSQNGHSVKGKITFGKMLPLKRDIMGPFASFPFMECKHGVISMTHGLSGELVVDDEKYSFDDGIGYIEKDMGISFPSEYMWTQGSDGNMSVVAAVAKIPYMVLKFPGCICSVVISGKEYRMATYNFAKATVSDIKTIIKRGKYRLEIVALEKDSHVLAAPVDGDMNRMVYESPAAVVRYTFSESGNTIAEMTCPNAGWERG